MNRRDLLSVVLPGAVVGATTVSAALVTREVPAATDPWTSPTEARALKADEYRDELERVAAEKILEIERIEAASDLGEETRKHVAGLYRFEANGMFVALRLLGGYGWTNFDREWARSVVTQKGAPRSATLSWPELPGGPAAGAQRV